MIDPAANANRIVYHFAIEREHGHFCSIGSFSILAARNAGPTRHVAESSMTFSTDRTTFASHHRNRFSTLFRKNTDTISIQNTSLSEEASLNRLYRNVQARHLPALPDTLSRLNNAIES